jgi:hypothetical protein
VQVRPLIQVLLLALVLPVGLAFLADWALGSAPLIALVVSIICIPLTTVLVIQRTLRDMNALIAVVAPAEEEVPEAEAGAMEDRGEAAARQIEVKQQDQNSIQK